MNATRPLGRTGLLVPRLGTGTMTWGQPSGPGRIAPAKLAYGGADGAEQEAAAFQASLAGGVTLFDTAAMHSRGASEERLGELAEGTEAIVATKFPPRVRGRTEHLPGALDASLARLRRPTIDLYQHHFPSRRVDIRALMEGMADAVEAGKVRAVGVSNYSAEQVRLACSTLAERGIPLASNQVQYSLLHRSRSAGCSSRSRCSRSPAPRTLARPGPTRGRSPSPWNPARLPSSSSPPARGASSARPLLSARRSAPPDAGRGRAPARGAPGRGRGR